MGVAYNVIVAKKRLPPDIRDFFVKMGRKGGKLGGSVRAANMTAEQRSERAQKGLFRRDGRRRRRQGEAEGWVFPFGPLISVCGVVPAIMGIQR